MQPPAAGSISPGSQPGRTALRDSVPPGVTGGWLPWPAGVVCGCASKNGWGYSSVCALCSGAPAFGWGLPSLCPFCSGAAAWFGLWITAPCPPASRLAPPLCCGPEPDWNPAHLSRRSGWPPVNTPCCKAGNFHGPASISSGAGCRWRSLLPNRSPPSFRASGRRCVPGPAAR